MRARLVLLLMLLVALVTALITIPIAVSAAGEIGVSAQPVLMAIAVTAYA